MCRKLCIAKNISRRIFVFGIIYLFIGACCTLQQNQSSVKADRFDALVDSIFVVQGDSVAPLTLLLNPNEGDIVNGTIFIQWISWVSEEGMNISFYLYLCNSDCDNCTSLLNSPYQNIGGVEWDTTYYANGTYSLFIEVKKDDEIIGEDSCVFQIQNHENQLDNNEPMTPSTPSGQKIGMTGQEYVFHTSTTDPDGESVYYMWDWGDGSAHRWLGPYNSGVICQATHTWSMKATYTIVVKAKDIYGHESNWSDPFSVNLRYIYNPIFRFFELFFQQFPTAFPYLRQFLGL